MVDCFVLLNSGDFVLLNDGTSKVIMNSCDPPQEGGGSGGRSKKRIGHQLTDLGPRPYFTQNGESHSKLLLRPLNKFKSRLLIRAHAESKLNIIRQTKGVSFSHLVISVSYESLSRIYLRGESWAVTHQSVLMERILRGTKGVQKAVKAMTYLNMINSVDEMYKGNDGRKQ